MLEVLSLGAGVQSSTVLLMSIVGELPKLDHAIFADTGWEPAAVYRHLEWLKSIAAGAGIPIAVVGDRNIREDAMVAQMRSKKQDDYRYSSMPYFVATPEGGQVKRQCTKDYKIVPIERYIRRELLGLSSGQHAPKTPVVRQWLGISVDEFRRAKDSRDKWKVHWYPLIEKRMTRSACLQWCKDHGFPEPPRSACLGCPFHSDTEWRRMKMETPDEFADAALLDDTVRYCGGHKWPVYLHRSMQPLREVDFASDVDKGQMLLWQDECDGLCGV